MPTDQLFITTAMDRLRTDLSLQISNLGRDLGVRISTLENKVDALPQTYPTLREHTELLQRVTRLETRDFDIVQRGGDRAVAVQQQIGQVAQEQQTRVQDVEKRASDHVIQITHNQAYAALWALMTIIAIVGSRILFH